MVEIFLKTCILSLKHKTIMKFFIALLLVASCQAFSIESMIEKEAFEFLIHSATAELEKLALEEVENVVAAGGKELTFVERQVINKFAATFGSVLADEVHEIIDQVKNAAEAKTLFSKKMYENLRMAALNITEGLHMAPKAAKKFLDDMMADIEAMEKSGTFFVDIENMFKNVIHKVAGILSYELIEKRGLSDIWSKINDTLMKVIGHLHGKFHDLHDFFKKIVKSAGEKLRPHVENIKTLAQDFLAHVNDVSATVAKQALAFFKPFAAQLGSIWVKLVQRVHDHLQKITDAGKPVVVVTPEPVVKVTPEPIPEGTPEPVVKASPEPVPEGTPEPVAVGTPEY